MGLASGSLIGLATLTLGWLGYTATQQPTVPAQAPSLDKHVTASFTNASMDEVLQWLRKTGVNFVIEQKDADRTFNINVVDKPLKDVMDAIASAAGGEWQKHGDVYSLNRGFAMPEILNEEQMREWERELAPMIEERMGDMRFEIDPEMRKHFEEIAPKIRESLGNFEFELGPEMHRNLMELAPRLRELMPEGGMRFQMLDDEKRQELLDSITPEQRELMKSRGHLLPEDLTSKQKEILDGFPGLLRIKDGDREFNLRVQHGDMLIAPPMPRIDAVPLPPTAGWEDLRASLTAEQKDLLKTQGHLYDDQLTAAQRRMVNLPSDSTYTLTIVNGDDSITIKSRKQ